MTPRFSALIPAAVVALALVLAGCVPEGPGTEGPSGSPSASPSGEAEPTPLTLPPCGDLLTRADIDRLVGADAVEYEIDPDAELTEFTPTPYTAEALTAAQSSTACGWGIPQTDAGFTVVVAELTTDDAEALRTRLASDATFAAEEQSGASVFTGEDEEGLGYGYALVLLGPLWITVQGPGAEQGREVGLQVLDTVRAANPGLPAAPVEPEPSETSSPSPSPSPSASPSPGAPDAAVLPACSDLIPLDTVRTLFGDGAEQLDSSGSPADHMPGPLAARTVRAASQSSICAWGIPSSDGGFSVVTAEITASARRELVDSLRSASGYRERAIDGEVAFTYETEGEIGSTAVVYVFVDSVWITVNGTLDTRTARQLAREALDQVRIANA
jgi:hypothetical protein